MNLTIAYITSRREPRIKWFFDSLDNQIQVGEARPQIIVVDYFARERDATWGLNERSFQFNIQHVIPKPTVWQGPARLTKEDWWAKSNALNTAIALCQTEWIAFVDDRCLLWRAWLDRVKIAMEQGYAVCGSYEKYVNLEVKDGVVVGSGESLGNDTRTPGNYPFDSWYGGSGALPLEWCLNVNGFSEDLCDSLGLEDSMFGVTLQNSGYPICYDSDMRIIEDRTQGQIDGALKRMDKGISPNDKSHAIVDAFRGKTTSQNSFDLRELRARVLAGEPFPPPTAPDRDWYDGQPISEM